MTPPSAPVPAPFWRKGLPSDADAIAYLTPCESAESSGYGVFLSTIMQGDVALLGGLEVWMVVRDRRSGALSWFERCAGRWAPSSRARAEAFSFVPLAPRLCLPVPWRTEPTPAPCSVCGRAPRAESLAVPVCICAAAEMGV